MPIDTHAHLFDEQFSNDLEEVIERIKLNKIQKVVIVGFSHSTNEKAFSLSKEFDFLYPTCGLHPNDASDLDDRDLIILEEFIKTHKVYAIGECGLDYYWHQDNKEKQQWLFESQIKLAIKYDLPLIVHSRDAINDTYLMLEKYKGKLRFVMHCYSGSLEMAERFIAIGGYISLGGPVTFKNAKEPKKVAENVDINRLMIETDCPYLAPTPYREKRNESSYVVKVLEEIASLRQINAEVLELKLNQNSELFFRI